SKGGQRESNQYSAAEIHTDRLLLTLITRFFGAALLHVRQAFRHFDIRSPGIFDKRDCDAKLRNLGVGTIQLDARGFELLRERLKVFDLEANVIDRSPRCTD